MKKAVGFGAALFFLSANAMAAGQVLLSATQHSGYTTPEDAFEYHCELSSTGAITGYVNSHWSGNGWSVQTPFSVQLTNSAVRKLERQIRKAQNGQILDGATVCDAGSTEISATIAGETSPFIIVKALDCDQIHVNQSRAALNLRVWVANECKIKY